ncbi:GAF domain-containing protein [Streptomyces sp. SCA3-4]|uniref:GAF domain-containing protein n=1 Tax=Streptomyces sichuanensis TaxID=2871810 RepID=UPI001CE3108A|nr:GAF domain-containing protein [Streptomyces sichuanensis]MCA6091209.1 GAF domain-containing protein [Streptomyces sichuanensis]
MTSSSALGAGVFVASVRAGDLSDPHHTTILWAGAVMAMAVVMVAASETALNEREKEQARKEVARAAGALRAAYHQTLTPLSEALGKLSQAHAAAYSAAVTAPPPALTNARSAQSPLILQTVLVGAAALTADLQPGSGHPAARSAYYRLADPARHMFTLEDWAGRPGPPCREIKGAAGSHFLHDVLEPRQPYHVGKETGLVSKVNQFSTTYRSVIAVPVVAGPREFGVLVVDAPKDTDLQAEHVHLMTALGGLLGATLALA